jgi:hypothetical protein
VKVKRARTFDSTPQSSKWNPNADINGDNFDIYDAIILVDHFNQHYPCRQNSPEISFDNLFVTVLNFGSARATYGLFGESAPADLAVLPALFDRSFLEQLSIDPEGLTEGFREKNPILAPFI